MAKRESIFGQNLGEALKAAEEKSGSKIVSAPEQPLPESEPIPVPPVVEKPKSKRKKMTTASTERVFSEEEKKLQEQYAVSQLENDLGKRGWSAERVSEKRTAVQEAGRFNYSESLLEQAKADEERVASDLERIMAGGQEDSREEESGNLEIAEASETETETSPDAEKYERNVVDAYRRTGREDELDIEAVRGSARRYAERVASARASEKETPEETVGEDEEVVELVSELPTETTPKAVERQPRKFELFDVEGRKKMLKETDDLAKESYELTKIGFFETLGVNFFRSVGLKDKARQAINERALEVAKEGNVDHKAAYVEAISAGKNIIEAQLIMQKGPLEVIRAQLTEIKSRLDEAEVILKEVRRQYNAIKGKDSWLFRSQTEKVALKDYRQAVKSFEHEVSVLKEAHRRLLIREELRREMIAPYDKKVQHYDKIISILSGKPEEVETVSSTTEDAVEDNADVSAEATEEVTSVDSAEGKKETAPEAEAEKTKTKEKSAEEISPSSYLKAFNKDRDKKAVIKEKEFGEWLANAKVKDEEKTNKALRRKRPLEEIQELIGKFVDNKKNLGKMKPSEATLIKQEVEKFNESLKEKADKKTK